MSETIKPPKPLSPVWEFLFFILLASVIALLYRLADLHAAFLICSPSFFNIVAKAAQAVFLFLLVLRIGFVLWDRIPERHRWILRESWGPFTLVVLSLWLFWGVTGSQFPSSYDHTTHILRCQLTERALWEHGTLLPWTSAVGAGVPLNDLYPPGGAIVYCLVRLFSFFRLSEINAYVVTVFLAWFVLVGALYSAGRYLGGVAAGMLAAIPLLIDMGTIGLIGWAQCFSISMWPMTLSAGTMILALLLYGSTLSRPAGISAMIALSILVAITILTHIFAFLGLLFAFAFTTVSGLCLSGSRCQTLRTILRNVFFAALGFGLAAWWAVPFFASKEWILPYGSPLSSSYNIAQHVLDGNLFQNTAPVLAIPGLFGCVWGLLSRRMLPTALAVSYAFMMAINQDTLKDWFFCESVSSLIMNVPLFRFSGYAKLFGFILAGAMAQPLLANTGSILQSIHRWIYGNPAADGSVFPLQWIAASSLASLIAALAIVPILPIAGWLPDNFNRLYGDSQTFPVTSSKDYPPYIRDFEKAMAYIESIEPVKSSDSFFLPLLTPRIGVQTNIIESSIPWYYGYGMLTPKYTPTMLLTTRSAWDDPSSYKMAGLKYFAGIGGVPKVMMKQQPQWKWLNTFGEITVLENVFYQVKPIFILENQTAQAALDSQDYGRVKIQLTCIDDRNWVRIGVSRYRKWRAYWDGQEIPIIEHLEPDEQTDLGRYISVLVGNGSLELRYESEPVDWLGTILTLLSIALSIACLVSKSVFRSVSFESDRIGLVLSQDRLNRILRWMAHCVFIIVLLALIALWLVRPVQSTRFWYAGITSDWVGRDGWNADGDLDMEFGFLIGKGCRGKTLHHVTMSEIRPEGFPASANRWTTGPEALWKIALLPYDDGKKRWGGNGEPLDVPLNPPHFVRVFIANPFRASYIPTGTKMEITLHFTDGTGAEFSCPLKPQGNH